MPSLHFVVHDLMIACDVVILSYFFLGNGIYTGLMLLALRATWLHTRRLAYQGLDALRQSPLAPPVTIIIPAWNEQDVIVSSVRSALEGDYPKLQVIVVDDGSTDLTVARLVEGFGLVEIDATYRPNLPTMPVRAFYMTTAHPNLLVVSKVRGGKPDALNAGINLSRSPYFCNLDADCMLEPDALLRLMDPMVNSAPETVVSGGIVRIMNGCRTKEGRIVQVGLPATGARALSSGRVLAQLSFWPDRLAPAGRDADRIRRLRRLSSRFGHRSRRLLSGYGNRRHGHDRSAPSLGGGE